MATDTAHPPLANKKFDQIFKALNHPARRQLIHALREDGPCDVGELTQEIAEPDHVGQTITKLRHVHLPYLDDAAILDWDRETNTLTTGTRYETTRQILQQMEAPEDVHQSPL